jgi:hypothetical protein
MMTEWEFKCKGKSRSPKGLLWLSLILLAVLLLALAIRFGAVVTISLR